ncbi:MAG: tRNA (guanosine(37)-N1)-methyltransferase TrmD [Clostridia bacterium]|nr:tRNA (guanosine(37)-N1)-methyltransferase TrmD [Clostridia bacterium]
MKFDVMTLFPNMVRDVLAESIIGRAQNGGIIEVDCHNIRDYSTDKHRKTDDTPYGGGVGMVMTCQPIYDCYRDIVSKIPEGESKRVIYMSPKGRIFSHEVAKELLGYDRLIFLCGHYEGVDQRVLDEIVDEEISIGDYVVTGGEIPACIVIDAVSRLLDGVLASTESYEGESVASGILEYPQYTKPRVFMDREVPEILLSGHHKKIAKWRLAEAVKITRERRPDLLLKHPEIEEELRPKSGRKKKKPPVPQPEVQTDEIIN